MRDEMANFSAERGGSVMAEPPGTRQRAQDGADSPPAAARSAHVGGGQDAAAAEASHSTSSSRNSDDDDNTNKRPPPPSDSDNPLLEPAAKAAREGDPSWAAHLPPIAQSVREMFATGEGAGERPLRASILFNLTAAPRSPRRGCWWTWTTRRWCARSCRATTAATAAATAAASQPRRREEGVAAPGVGPRHPAPAGGQGAAATQHRPRQQSPCE